MLYFLNRKEKQQQQGRRKEMLLRMHSVIFGWCQHTRNSVRTAHTAHW